MTFLLMWWQWASIFITQSESLKTLLIFILLCAETNHALESQILFNKMCNYFIL